MPVEVDDRAVPGADPVGSVVGRLIISPASPPLEEPTVADPLVAATETHLELALPLEGPSHLQPGGPAYNTLNSPARDRAVSRITFQLAVLADEVISARLSLEGDTVVRDSPPVIPQAGVGFLTPVSRSPQSEGFASALGTPESAQPHAARNPLFLSSDSESDSDSDGDNSVSLNRKGRIPAFTMSNSEQLFRGERDPVKVARFLRGVQKQLAGLTKPNLTNVTLAVQMCTELNMPVHAWVAAELQRQAKAALQAVSPLASEADLCKPLTAQTYNMVVKGFMKACNVQFRDPNLLCADALGQLRMSPMDTVEMHNSQFNDTLLAWNDDERPSTTCAKRLYLASLPPWLRATYSTFDVSNLSLESLMRKMEAVYSNGESLGMVPAHTDTQAWGSDASPEGKPKGRQGPRHEANRSPDRNRQVASAMEAKVDALTDGFTLLAQAINRSGQSVAAPAVQATSPPAQKAQPKPPSNSASNQLETMLKEMVEVSKRTEKAVQELSNRVGALEAAPSRGGQYGGNTGGFPRRQDRQSGPQSYNPRHQPGAGNSQSFHQAHNQAAQAQPPPPPREHRTATATRALGDEEGHPFVPHPLV